VLFQIEDAARDLSNDERRCLRQEKSKPIVEAFAAWLDEAKMKVLAKSPMMKAITYAQNQWRALERYLEDGRLSISNNAAERALRPIAVGRKNWLFFQREGGGETAAILMSLLQTAKAAGVNPNDYFKDVLLRISERGVTVKDLTPHGWKERFAPEVAARRHEILQRLVGAA
jgi:hypothetical protein